MLLVPVVYLIGRELVDGRAGVFAALVQTVSTFDVGFATTMTIDIPVSFLLSSSLLLFLKAEKAGVAGNIGLNFLAAFLILWSYYIKLPAPSIMLVFGALTLLRWRHWRRHFSLYAWVGVLMGATFAIDYWLHGDPLNYLHNELKYAAKPSPFSTQYHYYPEWMFTNWNWIRSYYYGFHFHLAVLALAWCLVFRETRRQVLPFLLWFAPIFLFLEFYPPNWTLPYEVMPRYFRYVHAFLPPTSLMSGVFLASLWRAAGRAGAQLAGGRLVSGLPRAAVGALILLYGALSVSQGLAIAALYREYYTDGREAIAFLVSLPPRPIYTDNNLHDRFNFDTSYARRPQARWDVDGVSIQAEIVPSKDLEPFRGLTDGYVILGGSRGVNYGAVLLRGSFEPPADWKLIFESDRPIDKYRREPLRIYEVSPDPGSAD